MSLQGHAALKYITGRQIVSSSERGWTNVRAERWNHQVGELHGILPRETELVVLLSGRTLVDRRALGLRQSTLGLRGTAWLCPAGIQEDFIHVREPAENCLHLFLPAKPFADVIVQDLDVDPGRVSLRYDAIHYDPFIEQIALAINKELSAETSAGRLLVESLGHSLSAYLVQRYAELPVGVRHLSSSGKPIDNQRMSRVMEFIDARIDRNFTVADLAAVACMSPAHFARSFKTTTGRRPHEFVSRMRLKVAKQMLADRDRSMSDIALSTGFSSQSNFARAFRDSTGMTPGDYRVSQIGSRLQPVEIAMSAGP